MAAHQKTRQHTVFNEQVLHTIGRTTKDHMTMPLTMNDAGELPLPISGCDVTYLRVDFAFTFVVDHPHGTFELSISCPFRFADRFGASVIDPELEPELLGPVLRLAREGFALSAHPVVSWRSGTTSRRRRRWR